VYLMSTVWNGLFRIGDERAVSSGEAYAALMVFCGICLALLVKKVRAYEVVQ